MTPSPPARPGLHICPYPPRVKKLEIPWARPHSAQRGPARPSAPSPAPARESRRPHKLTSTHTRKQGEEEGEKRPSKWASEMTVLNGPPSALARPSLREYTPAQEDSRTYAQARHGEEKSIDSMGLRPSSALRLLVWPSLREQAPAVRDKHTPRKHASEKQG